MQNFLYGILKKLCFYITILLKFLIGLVFHPFKNSLFILEVILAALLYSDKESLTKYIHLFIGFTDYNGTSHIDIPKMFVFTIGLTTLLAFISNSLFKDLLQSNQSNYYLGFNKERFYTYRDLYIKLFAVSPLGLLLFPIDIIPILIALFDMFEVTADSLLSFMYALWISAYFLIVSFLAIVVTKCFLIDTSKFSQQFTLDGNQKDLKHRIEMYISKRCESSFRGVFNNQKRIRYLYITQVEFNNDIFNRLVDLVQIMCRDETERETYFETIFGRNNGISAAISQAINKLASVKHLKYPKVTRQELFTIRFIYMSKWQTIYETLKKDQSIIPPNSVVNMGLIDLHDLHILEGVFIKQDNSILEDFKDIFWGNRVEPTTALYPISDSNKSKNESIDYIVWTLQYGFDKCHWMEKLRENNDENMNVFISLYKELKEIDKTQEIISKRTYAPSGKQNIAIVTNAKDTKDKEISQHHNRFFSRVFDSIFSQIVDCPELNNSKQLLKKLSQPGNDFFEDAVNLSKIKLFEFEGSQKKIDSLEVLLSFLSLSDIVSALIIILFWRRRDNSVRSTMSTDEFDLWNKTIRREFNPYALDINQQNRIIEELEENVKSNIDYFADKTLVGHLGKVMNSELNDKQYQEFKNLKGDIHVSSRTYFLLYLLLNRNYTIFSDPIIFFTGCFSDEVTEEIKKELDLPADTCFLDKHNICD
ncbi:MAG: hypothetical protein ACLU6V_01545 [Lancefieldella rimae]